MALDSPIEPIESVLQEIQRALDSRLYFASLVATLALPDICAALASPDGKTTSQLYRDWYAKNMGTLYALLPAEECWNLRCGVVHQGRSGNNAAGYEKVKFSTGIGSGVVCDNNILNEGGVVYLNLDLGTFCANMMNAVRTWYSNEKNSPNVLANIENVMRVRPMGAISGVFAIY